jgi:hypothetical protein
MEGVLREYTTMPNLVKLDYHIFALTFCSMKKGLTREKTEQARTQGVKRAIAAESNIVVIDGGIGLNHDVVIGSFHEDYSSYSQLMQTMRTKPYLDTENMESFLMDSDDKIHYRPLTLATLAQHLLGSEGGHTETQNIKPS